jgi:hypothetical protein
MINRTALSRIVDKWLVAKGAASKKPNRQWARTRLHVESLEDRRLLSVSAITRSVDLSGWYCYSTSSAAVTLGQTVSLTCQVKRTGNLGTSSFNVQWYLSKTTSITSDSVLLSLSNGSTSYNHAAISAKSAFGPLFAVSLKLPAALPSSWSGSTFYIIMKTDSSNAVAESNEKNNAGQLGNTYDRWAIKINSTTTNKAPTVATAAAASSSTVNSTTVTLSVLGADDGGESNLKYTWVATTLPSGASSPTFRANGTNAAKSTLVTFSAAGTYTFKVTIADTAGLTATSTVQVTVSQTLTSVTITPSIATLSPDAQQQFAATALDQFGKTMASQPAFTWKASSGTITSSGLYTAPGEAGTGTVTATTGSFSVTASLSIVVAQFLGMTDAALATLTQSLYADGSISRLDMIQILQSVGTDDSVVDTTELASLKIILNNATYLGMAGYVQVLASDVVNGNTANACYQDSTLGNLAVGSTGTQLSLLINKWFYGTDHPTTTSSSYTYVTVSGSLFVDGASYTDMYQGNLGDCYFLAALGAIAKSNSTAITNIFTDNGDGTWTVCFYYQSGSSYVADYVTVDNMLPASGTTLVYAGYGSTCSSSSNELWMALLEKAYAQWNETGHAGRDGTNTYAGIESGWMYNVNAQVLGAASSTYSFSNSSKQILIAALSSGKAVTLGTSKTADGLYGSHAYVVLSYDSTTGTFQLYNPWGNSHPGALTWAQLQADCSTFVIADPSGVSSTGIVGRSLVASPVEIGFSNLDSPLAANSPTVGQTTSRVEPGAPATPPLEAGAADVCYRTWQNDSLWSSQMRARRSAGDPMDELVSAALGTV